MNFWPFTGAQSASNPILKARVLVWEKSADPSQNGGYRSFHLLAGAPGGGAESELWHTPRPSPLLPPVNVLHSRCVRMACASNSTSTPKPGWRDEEKSQNIPAASPLFKHTYGSLHRLIHSPPLRVVDWSVVTSRPYKWRNFSSNSSSLYETNCLVNLLQLLLRCRHSPVLW